MPGPEPEKTKTLTSKIAWLIGNHHAKPEEILAITFTNKAARELNDRLKILLKNKVKTVDLKVATFHAFGLSILNEFYFEFNRTKNFILADEILKLEIIKSIFDKKANDVKKQSIEISEIKKESQSENSFFRNYEKELQKLNAFDLDDLLEKPLKLLTEKEKIAVHFRKKYRYIFIDEYQDTNDIQYRLLRMLAPDFDSNLCVVGDVNQSIYGFRGSNPDYISKFTTDYPEAKIFRLTKSYRCSQTILKASSNVIDQKSGFLEGVDEGVQISISEQPTGAAEAEFIARSIVDLIGGMSFFSIDSSVAKGNKNESIISLSDIAVLCRTRNQFEAISKALRDHHVPHQETGTIPFFQQEPFQSFIDLLHAFSIENYESAKPILKLKKNPITQLQFELAQIQIQKTEPILFLNFIKENYFSSEIFKPEDWNRFISLAKGTKSISEFLQFLKLGIGTDAHNTNLETVSVMTLHASKGLEFECVFIPGCEEGLLPYNLYKTKVDEEEEKRLLYVGMTRAKKLLYLTNAKSRIIRNRKFNLPASPFLNSIQQELLQQLKNKSFKKSDEKDNQLSLF